MDIKDDQKPSGSKKNDDSKKIINKIKDVPKVKSEGSFRSLMSHFTKTKPKNESDKKVLDDNRIKIVHKPNTVTDAAVMQEPEDEPLEKYRISGIDEMEVKSTEMVVDKYADEYNMTHARRGLVVILNHETFDREDRREGTHKDVETLEKTLTHLGFEVQIHHDLEYTDVQLVMKSLGKKNYTDCDCLAIFVLTHGDKHGNLSAKDMYYPVNKLWNHFTPDDCLTLAGKPKLFFINACRGKRKDVGVRFFKGRTQADSSKQESYKIPKHADFLMAYSTVDGYFSYRDPTSGSWFIQCLCECLMEHHNTTDLLKILTLTSKKVALDRRTVSDHESETDLTQIPSFTSMLIRDVYFKTE